MNKGSGRSICLLLLITLGFGFSFILIKELMNANYPVFLLLALRFLIGTFSLFAFRMIKPFPINKDDVKYGVVVGMALFFGFLFQTTGAAFTTPAKNGLYTGLYVLFVPTITMIRQKKFTLKPVLLAVLCFAGVAIISNVFGDITFNIGDLLTTFCALSFAIQFILLEKYSPSLNPVNFTIVQLATVAIISSVISFLLERDSFSMIKADKYLLMIVFLGLFETGISFLIQTYVQSQITANVVALVSCMESVFAMGFSLVFGYDILSMTLILGSILIIASMVISSISNPELKGEK